MEKRMDEQLQITKNLGKRHSQFKQETPKKKLPQKKQILNQLQETTNKKLPTLKDHEA